MKDAGMASILQIIRGQVGWPKNRNINLEKSRDLMGPHSQAGIVFFEYLLNLPVYCDLKRNSAPARTIRKAFCFSHLNYAPNPGLKSPAMCV